MCSLVVAPKPDRVPDAMGNAITTSVAEAVSDAVSNYLAHGVLVATRTLPVTPSTDSVRSHLLLDSTDWKTLPDKKTQYTEYKFCYVSSYAVFATALQLAYNITMRFDAKKFIKGLVDKWTPSSVPEYFVLSKIHDNMFWHIDGGKSVDSDMVVYNVLGPSDSVSCFLLLVVDTTLLQQAQLADPSFPTCEEIEAGLLLLDELQIPLKMPDLTGCEATFRGLMRKPELNNIRVVVKEVDADKGRYLVKDISGDSVYYANPRYLQFDSGYLRVLPDEILCVLPRLSLAVQRAVNAGVVRCQFIWARECDVVVFDGSKIHAVFNIESDSRVPQLAVAVNFRGVMPHVEQQKKRGETQALKTVRFKLRGVS